MDILKKLTPAKHLMFLTWLFDNKEDGFATGIFIILKTLHAIVLIFVGAIHRICVMELCVEKCWHYITS